MMMPRLIVTMKEDTRSKLPNSASVPCTHHWDIPYPGLEVVGRCRKCGESKVFHNEIVMESIEGIVLKGSRPKGEKGTSALAISKWHRRRERAD